MRYAVFAWTTYYERGGWLDLWELVDSFEAARIAAERAQKDEDDEPVDHWLIVDLDAGLAIEGAVSHTIWDGDYYPPGRYWERYDASDPENASEAHWKLMHRLTPRGTVFDREGK